MRAQFRKLPEIISGKQPDVNGIGRVFKSYFAYHWFEKVRQAYIKKSQGGTDENGIRWTPNAPSTIARRPMRESDMRLVRGKSVSPVDERVRGLLTPAQDALWRAIFRSNYLRLLSRESPGAAKARAAQIAWGILKRMGAQTKFDVLSKRNLPIGISSGALLQACSPGVVTGSIYNPPPGQKIQYRNGGMDFKITVPYSDDFHKKRPIWPAAYKAKNWIKYAARKALEATAAQIARSGKLK